MFNSDNLDKDASTSTTNLQNEQKRNRNLNSFHIQNTLSEFTEKTKSDKKAGEGDEKKDVYFLKNVVKNREKQTKPNWRY